MFRTFLLTIKLLDLRNTKIDKFKSSIIIFVSSSYKLINKVFFFSYLTSPCRSCIQQHIGTFQHLQLPRS